MPESVEKLEIWQDAMKQAKAVYELTRSWPKAELYGLISQARRAVVSVPANLAEGLGRGTPKEIARFAQIALGSLYELDTLLHLAFDVGYGPEDKVQEVRGGLTILAKRISSYIAYQEGRE